MKNLTNEMLQKAKECKTVAELLNLAKENDYPLTEEQATKTFNEWNKTGELADEELENVAGGCKIFVNMPSIGEIVEARGVGNNQPLYCETCGSERYIVEKVEDSDIHVRCVTGCANVYDNSSTRVFNVNTAFIGRA